MKIKEIAKFTGKSEKTIIREVKKLFPGLVRRGVATDISDRQFETLIMELNTKGILECNIARQNVEPVRQNVEVINTGLERAIENMNNLAAALMANVQNQNNRIQALEQKFKTLVDALPAPQISPRDEISKIVRAAAEEKQNYRDLWHELYNDFNYRMKRNFSYCAKNRDMTIMDYIESEGMIGKLLATARELFQGGNQCR